MKKISFSLRLDGLIIDNEMRLNGAIKYCKFDKSCEVGMISTNKSIYYLNWSENTSVCIVPTHISKITSINNIYENHLSTTSIDGSLSIWSIMDREKIVQFDAKSPVNIFF